MNCLILADIHANLTALEAVLADAERRGKIGEVWCPGDIVGYGPYPRECIALLRKTSKVCVAGNHDWAVAGKIDTADFNPSAAAASKWTAQQLTSEDVEYLGALPQTIEKDEYTIVHGSPREPVWEYLFSIEETRENLTFFKTPVCIIGHTHQPAAFVFDESGKGTTRILEDGTELKLDAGRVFINPGSVGQPRDRDPRASYGILDIDNGTFILHRVAYDIPSVQERMRERGLPPLLISRLGVGM
jgi:predicted phosphodiesterase